MQSKTTELFQNESEHKVIKQTDQGDTWTNVYTSVETPISGGDFSKVLHSKAVHIWFKIDLYFSKKSSDNYKGKTFGRVKKQAQTETEI